MKSAAHGVWIATLTATEARAVLEDEDAGDAAKLMLTRLAWMQDDERNEMVGALTPPKRKGR